MKHILACIILSFSVLVLSNAYSQNQPKPSSQETFRIKTLVQEWLTDLRKGTTQYEYYIGSVREAALKANLSLEEVGTSEKELRKLYVLGAKTSAQDWLTYLRKGTMQYEAHIGSIREEALKGNLSLEEIGTSEEELQKLYVLGAKTSAQEWLAHLRKGNIQYEAFIGYVFKDAAKGKFSLEDIGTSEEELQKLYVLGAKTSAQKWLTALRTGHPHYEALVEYVREEARKGKFSLKDIGTSEEELQKLYKPDRGI